MKKCPVTRKNERGFALLVVFLMAAVIGMYLYTQLPRVAFESERDKEQTLIDRGEQYKRAIQLYVAAVKKYPQKIEDLENTNEKRYLRRRYIDPMTGKDEWRLIHVNAAGQLTDSLVQKPPCGALGSNSGTGTSPTGSSTSSGTSSGTSNTSSSSSFSSTFSTSSSSTSSSSSSMGSSSMGSSSMGSSSMGSSSMGSNTTGSSATDNCTASPTGSGTASGTAVASGSGTGSGTAGATPTNANDVNAAVRARPSDLVGQAYTQPSATNDPNDPSTWAPITLAPVNANGTANGAPPSGAVGFNGGLLGQIAGQNAGQNAGQGGFNGQQQAGLPGQVGVPGVGAGGFPLPGQPGFNPTQNQFKIDSNGQLVPVTPTQTPAQTSTANNTQSGFGNTTTTPPAPGQPFSIPPGTNSMAPPANGALSGIMAGLQNPNPAAGGLGTSAGMTTGGIAGIASMYKGPSIKIYGTRQKYQEWEFVFSLNDQQNGANGQNRNPLQPGQNGLNGQPGQPGQNGTTGTGSNGTGTNGSSSGFTIGTQTGSSGTGNPGTGNP